METKWQEFNEISWDSIDLISCKQAVGILYGMGISEEELLTLDFGNLDIIQVIEEIEETSLSSF